MWLIEVLMSVACEEVCKSNFLTIHVVEHHSCLGSL